MTDAAGPWVALAALGAGHGINPAMGWLFAVALGIQRGTRRAVLGALLPLAAGHAAAVGAVVAAAVLAGSVVPPSVLRYVVAALLVGLGAWRLARTRHPGYGGMRASARELAVWSFLMASAHGAGLMVLPLVLPGGATIPGAHGTPMSHAAAGVAGSAEAGGLLVALAHTAGYLAVTAAVALLVYERLGLRRLRAMWVNLDLVWGVALIVSGLATLAPA